MDIALQFLRPTPPHTIKGLSVLKFERRLVSDSLLQTVKYNTDVSDLCESERVILPDKLSREDRSKTMSAVKGKGTSLERKLWSMLAGMRLNGWRRNAPDVPGTPDAAFYCQKVAIFVDGCFWHKCPHCDRSSPDTNAEYWEKKFNNNVQRDKEVDKKLIATGWNVVRIWEHEMKNWSERREARVRILEILK